jgi:alkaline phosphatase
MACKKAVWIVILVLIIGGCKTGKKSPVYDDKQQKATNIILMIGDGMGLTQISAAAYSSNKPLAISRFPYVGFHKAHSSNNLITDSAAGATAFACGLKTYNGAVGVDNDTIACTSILAELDSYQYATGMVATSTIVHATPAAFIAHEPMRVNYEEIAADFLDTEIDLFIGGGKKYFDRREKDDRNLIEDLKANNYYVADYFHEKLDEVIMPSQQNFAYFTADKHPLTKAAGRDYLPFATRFAISFLKRHSSEGFFLMVEGSQIDWGGHSNDSGLVIEEILDFDKAVREALRFAEKDGETLLIVTADHECGGMSISDTSIQGNIEARFSTNGHTAALVPVFAYGPGAEKFSGIYENTEIYYKMKEALQLDDHSTVYK